MSVAIVEMPEKMTDNPADTYGRNCSRASQLGAAAGAVVAIVSIIIL